MSSFGKIRSSIFERRALRLQLLLARRATYPLGCSRTNQSRFSRSSGSHLSRHYFMTCGATLACVGILVATLWANEAQDFWRQEAAKSRPAPMQAIVPHASPGTTSSDRRTTTSTASPQRLKITVQPKRENRVAEDDDGRPRSSGGQYCVRVCDGYYFPLPSQGTLARDTEACQAACPGAPVEVYSLGRGDGIEDAVSLKGKLYSSLPTSLSYRSQLAQACSCKIERQSGFAALLRDKTLVSGDIVVTEKGVYVFAGARRFPYRESDFAPLSKARGLPRQVATYLAGINRLAR